MLVCFSDVPFSNIREPATRSMTWRAPMGKWTYLATFWCFESSLVVACQQRARMLPDRKPLASRFRKWSNNWSKHERVLDFTSDLD